MNKKFDMKHLTPYEEGFNERLQDPKFRAIWEAEAPRRAVVSAIIGARIKYKLTQRQLAKKAGLEQPNLARIESGTVSPSLGTLGKIAEGLGKKLEVRFI